MMIIGHIAGAPLEELLVPLLASSGASFLIAARVALSRWQRRSGP